MTWTWINVLRAHLLAIPTFGWWASCVKYMHFPLPPARRRPFHTERMKSVARTWNVKCASNPKTNRIDSVLLTCSCQPSMCGGIHSPFRLTPCHRCVDPFQLNAWMRQMSNRILRHPIYPHRCSTLPPEWNWKHNFYFLCTSHPTIHRAIDGMRQICEPFFYPIATIISLVEPSMVWGRYVNLFFFATIFFLVHFSHIVAGRW